MFNYFLQLVLVMSDFVNLYFSKENRRFLENQAIEENKPVVSTVWQMGRFNMSHFRFRIFFKCRGGPRVFHAIGFVFGFEWSLAAANKEDSKFKLNTKLAKNGSIRPNSLIWRIERLNEQSYARFTQPYWSLSHFIPNWDSQLQFNHPRQPCEKRTAKCAR